jgi:hypothetical protein
MKRRRRCDRGSNPGFFTGDADARHPSASAAWWATRLNYIVAKYNGVAKPRHRERSAPLRTPNGEETSFGIGRFLNQVAEICLDGKAHTLGSEGERLRALPWFAPWLGQLRRARAKRKLAWRPSIDAAVSTVLDSFSSNTDDAAHKRHATFVVTVAPECNVAQPLSKWMLRFAEARRAGGIHPRLLARLEARPWAAEWLSELDGFHASAVRRRVLTKMARIELLLLNCRHEVPGVATIIPVSSPCMEEGVYFWRPRAWLDDVADNWLRPETANTRLDASEMAVMETALPWVDEWLDGKRDARERRAAQRV